MKQLILIRHAKSCWEQPWQDDHDRPLAARGLHDAPIMAKRLVDRGILPDLILSSSATRAVQTAKILAEQLGLSPNQIEIEKNLYHALPHIILKYIQIQKDSIHTLIIVGHNPGLNELVNLLGTKLDNLPTAGQIGFKLDLDHWSQFKTVYAKFWFIDFPNKTT
jgi:phosphohistidine phosphatase